MTESTPARIIRDYHQRTKHRLDGYAAGPGSLDWEDQPNPFRRYTNAPLTSLPLPEEPEQPAFGPLSRGELPDAAPLDMRGLSQLLGLSLGLAAWKEYAGDRWALRCNPSSGNLHPTEAYLLLPGTEGITAGVHHYCPEEHALEQRCRLDADTVAKLAEILPEEHFLLGLSSIPWREAWKYGERAWRYCQLDLGHALGALRYAAAAIGWRVYVLDHHADTELAALMGLDRTQDFETDEPEYPEMLCLIGPADAKPLPSLPVPRELVHAIASAEWRGKANRLSPRHMEDWPLVDEAARAATKPVTVDKPPFAAPLPKPRALDCELPVSSLIRARRSAQAFDGAASMTADDFYTLLDHCLPRPDLPPWTSHPHKPAVHLLLFVHRVDGLPPGLYALVRHADEQPALQMAMRGEFQWHRPEGCPMHLPLYHLVQADARRAAARLACQQSIASDGVFSLAMLGEFEHSLQQGPWGYRHLLCEAGQLGQLLYLQAEALRLQGTGMGCFFDDGLHEVFGLNDQHYQVVYEFTLGRGVTDTRIRNRPAYADR